MITMTKRRNPTMTKRRRSQVLLEADQEKLFQGLTILEREWESFNSTSKPGRRGSSTNSDANNIVNSLPLLNNSPRSLMTSLQAGVRSKDAAMEEIRRDRKAAIESGKLKGRRLFEAEESEAEAGFGEREEISSTVTSYGNEGKGSNCDQRSSEEEKVCGYCGGCRNSGSDLSSLSDEKEDRGGVAVVVGGGKVVGVNVDEVKRDEISFVNGGGRWIMVMIKGWFTVVLMVFAVGVFIMRCNGGYGVEDEVMLVPT